MTNTSPRIHLTLKEDERGSKKKKNRWRDFFLLICLRFGIVNFYIATEQAKYILDGTGKKWTQFFRRYFNIVYSYQLKRNLNAGKCLTKKMRFAGIFPLKMVFYFSRTWAYQGKVGHSNNNKKRMKKRRIRERLAKNARSLPWKMELYIWNIWQNSRPFTWMIFYKAPLPPSIFIITNDGKDGILGDVLCFALPLSRSLSLPWHIKWIVATWCWVRLWVANVNTEQISDKSTSF